VAAAQPAEVAERPAAGRAEALPAEVEPVGVALRRAAAQQAAAGPGEVHRAVPRAGAARQEVRLPAVAAAGLPTP